jgi:hypothetical protein
MKKHTSRLVAGAITAACALACAAGAQAAGSKSIAYTPVDLSTATTYLVDWNEKKHHAHVVEYFGAGDGTFSDDGSQRVVNFGKPLSYEASSYDCNGEPMTQRVDLQQMVFRAVSGTAARGTSQVVELGTLTDIDGCTPGAVAPFGALDDPGLTTNHLDMARRAPVTDLVPGARLAGPSETPHEGEGFDLNLMVQSITTFGAGNLRFEDTGHVFPISTSDGWIVVDFGGFQRGFTRLTRDTKGGTEMWLQAAWNGAPMNVMRNLMVQPNAAAGFGGRNAVAHTWSSGLFLASVSITWYDLYRDGTGQRVIHDTVYDQDYTLPVTWLLDGANLVTNRLPYEDGSYAHRTWVPVANFGKNHFVMESEDVVEADGTFVYTRFTPRVNFYVDGGKAFPPSLAARATKNASHDSRPGAYVRP